jgi:hypothetical protein
MLPGMFPVHVEELDVTAAEVRSHLFMLEAERALARENGLDEVATYAAELNEEIELCRQVYIVFAVTEIATLRAEMSGPQIG